MPAPAAYVGGDLLDNLANSPFIDGASQGAVSKIVMAIESIRQGDFPRAREFLQTALAENHAITAGWLGLCYLEGMSTKNDYSLPISLDRYLKEARRHAPKDGPLVDAYCQILTDAAVKAGTNAVKSFTLYSQELASCLQSQYDSRSAEKLRANSIFIGTTAAVMADRVQGVIPKAFGYTVAANSALVAVESHLQARDSQLKAENSTRAYESAHADVMVAMKCAFECVQVAGRMRAQCTPYTHKKLAEVTAGVFELIAMNLGFEAKQLGLQLPAIRSRLKDPRFVAANLGGTPAICTFVDQATNFRLDHLPVVQKARKFFPELQRILQDAKLRRTEDQLLAKRRRQRTVGAILGWVSLSWPLLFLFFVYKNDENTGDFEECTMLASPFLAFAGLLIYKTAYRGPFPIDTAVRRHFENLLNDCQETQISASDFGSGYSIQGELSNDQTLAEA